MPGSGSPDRGSVRERITPRLPAFRRHALVFSLAALALIAANVLVGSGWWTFWPLVLWSILLGIHYLAHKTRTVDDAWVRERTEDLRSKSYDAGHIDAIRKDPDPPGAKTPPPR